MSAANERLRSVVLGILGILIFVGMWELIGINRWAGLTWPPFTTVLAFLFDPSRQALFVRAMAATFSMAGYGYLLGTLIGMALAALVQILPPLRPGIDRLSSVVNAIPAIALAPLFIVLLDRELTGMAIATLNVFFILYVATTSGLNNASAAHRDLFQVLGSSAPRRVWELDLPVALPAIVSGLKFSIPAAFIGAILGEWFGASRGLGLLMVSAMQNFQIPLLWSAVFIASAASLLAFGIMGLVERFVYGRFQ
jgi:ABC-type nitrate/sulfonate/bicarbonate transport system permease component